MIAFARPQEIAEPLRYQLPPTLLRVPPLVDAGAGAAGAALAGDPPLTGHATP